MLLLRGLYLSSLVGAIIIGTQLAVGPVLTLGFAFVCWAGGWTANDLYAKRGHLTGDTRSHQD